MALIQKQLKPEQRQFGVYFGRPLRVIEGADKTLRCEELLVKERRWVASEDVADALTDQKTEWLSAEELAAYVTSLKVYFGII